MRYWESVKYCGLVKFDAADSDAAYKQIAKQLRKLILNGTLLPGEALPSTRALASELYCNFMTVNKAYNVLRDEGFGERQGIGMIVAKVSDFATYKEKQLCLIGNLFTEINIIANNADIDLDELHEMLNEAARNTVQR